MTLVQTKVRVFAFNRSTAEPVLSDAANITAKWAKDYGTPTALTDVNPVEAEDGFYYFDLSSGERAVTIIGELFPESSTTGVQVIGVPAYFMPHNIAEGEFLIPLTLRTAGGTIIPYCDVVLTTSSAGDSIAVVTSGISNEQGRLEFNLDAGTYYLWRNKARYSFTDPMTLVVDDTGTLTVS